MSPKSPVALLITVLVLGGLASPSLAVDMVDNYLEWVVTPDSSRHHPKKYTMAFLVTESFALTACEIGYSRVRSSDGSPPAMETRGKMKATLKVVKKNKTVKIGTKRMAIEETWEYGNGAFLMWADPSGADWYAGSVNTGLLPLDLEPGDVIEWTVRFSGVSDLEVESTGSMEFADVISLRAGYYNCGTFDYPCLQPTD